MLYDPQILSSRKNLPNRMGACAGHLDVLKRPVRHVCSPNVYTRDWKGLGGSSRFGTTDASFVMTTYTEMYH